jgi:hypothetical protein
MDTVGLVITGIIAAPFVIIILIFCVSSIVYTLRDIILGLAYVGEQEAHLVAPMVRSLRVRIPTFRATVVPAGRQSRRAKDRARK